MDQGKRTGRVCASKTGVKDMSEKRPSLLSEAMREKQRRGADPEVQTEAMRARIESRNRKRMQKAAFWTAAAIAAVLLAAWCVLR